VNLLGIDPCESCVLNVRQKGFDAVKSSISSLGKNPSLLGGRHFDLVITTGVLEHVYALGEAVRSISLLLTEEGRVLVRVPDAARYASYYVAPFFYFDLEHINHFGQNDISNLFKRHGFETLRSGVIDFSASDEFRYPDVFCLFRRSRPATSEPMIYSDETRASVRHFIEKSNLDSRSLRALEQLRDSGEPIVVWGAGMNTFRLLASSALGDCKIIAFIDNDAKKQGKTLHGRPIVSVDFLRDFPGTVVLSSPFHNNQIDAQIKSAGFSNRTVRI
jgi:hypothetical protein